MRNSPTIAGFLQCNGEKLEEAEDFIHVSFIVFLNRNRSIVVHELLSNNSLSCQLYEDKSLALQARDLIFFTTDLQTVTYYSTIHC